MPSGDCTTGSPSEPYGVPVDNVYLLETMCTTGKLCVPQGAQANEPYDAPTGYLYHWKNMCTCHGDQSETYGIGTPVDLVHLL